MVLSTGLMGCYVTPMPIPENQASKVSAVEVFCGFLCPESSQVGTLNQGLKNLLQFVLAAYFLKKSYTVRLVLVDTVAAMVELGSLLYDEPWITRETDSALHKLLQKNMLLVLEAILTNFDLPESESIPLKQCHFNFIESGLIFFLNFLGNESVNSEPLWKYIIHIFSLTKSSSNDVRNSSVPLFRQHILTIRILKMEIKLKELLYRSQSLLPTVRKQMQTLHKEVLLVTTFLAAIQGGNRTLEGSVLEDVYSGFVSFNWNEISEHTLRSFSLELFVFLKKIMLACEEKKGMYLRDRSSLLSPNFSKTPEFGFMDFLLRDLQELLNSEHVKFPLQIQVIHGHIDFFRSFLNDVGNKHYDFDHSDLKGLVLRILQVALQVEYISDSLLQNPDVAWYLFPWLSSLIEDTKLIKVQISEISNELHGIRFDDFLQSTNNVMPPSKISEIDEVVINRVDDECELIAKLTRGSKQLDIASIVGMAGIGKTTLARKIYYSYSVSLHFHTRAWCHVSQLYHKRKLLIEILGDVMEITNSILEMRDDELELKLYQCLKGKRYLIIIDDLWSTDAWNDLQHSFPNDGNESRILITSRLHDVVPKIQEDSIHHLPLLTDAESWELLNMKLFKEEACPEDLLDPGKKIASSCDGLPLTVVTISGLLQGIEKTSDWCKQVGESLSSLIADSEESRCMDKLRLSYNHLPNHLKLCFLYLGAFFGYKEIPVRKLIRLWVAEGLVQHAGERSAEDVAEELLTGLIGRSLVMASKRRSDRGIKTCCLHDMVLILCSRICEEESYLEQVTWRDEVFSGFSEDLDYGVHPNHSHLTDPVTYSKRRPSIYSRRNHFVMSRPSGPHVHSLLYFATSDSRPECPHDISLIPGNFKRLRVLDLECINLGHTFPEWVEDLVRLRYLALSGNINSIPNSIAKLRNLQTLVLVGLIGRVLLPDTIWSMVKLQYLHVRNGAFFSFQGTQMENPPQLPELVSLSSPLLYGVQDAEKILIRLPKLRRLTCIFSDSRDVDTGDRLQFPVLSFLKDLKSLKITYSGRNFHPRKFDFPWTLTKLTLSKFRLPWDCISEIGKLPNIEVLKLLAGAFDGEVWDMKDGEFQKLRYLKLDNLNVVHWNASEDNLPKFNT
ncbi:OLC1v1031567C1 [Oldenlandia corymbosa var. corymbosa]|uniref:OLC1v1031567C1 n=1 Tax=Oldenlandia corymbosa var. corymbosa TaxID=529605 RepID=A0AAV1CIR1_OLDCO|nr:OLC1v1031567C1 [Oldenlandia corymbosa var. corymbosa]